MPLATNIICKHRTHRVQLLFDTKAILNRVGDALPWVEFDNAGRHTGHLRPG